MLLADDFRPRELAHLEDLLLDLPLRRLLAEDAAKIINLRRDQLVVLGKEANGGVLKVAFRHGDQLRCSGDLIAHTFSHVRFGGRDLAVAITVFWSWLACALLAYCETRMTAGRTIAPPSGRSRAHTAHRRYARRASVRRIRSVSRRCFSPSPNHWIKNDAHGIVSLTRVESRHAADQPARCPAPP